MTVDQQADKIQDLQQCKDIWYGRNHWSLVVVTKASGIKCAPATPTLPEAEDE